MSENSDTEQNNVVHHEHPNPLLQRMKIPGETFTLPSRGIFYTNGEVDEDTAKTGEIYIYPMVTFDEIILKTPDKLFSGEAIVDVFSRCVPAVKKPLDLLAKDVDYILVCLRKLTYGNELEINYTHDCADAKEHPYKISMEPFISKSKPIDPTIVNQTYSVTFDNGQVLHLSPPRFQHVIRIYQNSLKDIDDVDVEDMRQSLTDTIVGMIQSVDDIHDEKMIREWVEKIPAGWTHKIAEQMDVISDWGPEFDTEVKCKDCEKMMTVSTPINPLAFFI